MPVAKHSELTASSKKGFEDAVRVGIVRAAKTLDNVSSAWIKDQSVVVKNGKIIEYRVNMKVTFLLK